MDSVCTLIKETKSGRDVYGNPTVTRTGRQVYCQIFSVGRSEFYAASNAGLKPELIVRLGDFAEYDGEQLAEVDGDVYTIIRTYRDRGSMHVHGGRMDANAIELTLGRKVGDAHVKVSAGATGQDSGGVSE